MPRFTAIEGLRAWLAWAVVAWHLVQMEGLARDSGPMTWFAVIGDAAVMVFIAISGFVIAGLVIAKAEPYPQYILRRAFRIFPVYLVILTFAFAALPLGLAGGDHVQWAGDPAFYYDEVMHGGADTIKGHPLQEIGLRLVLMQGIVPDSIWPMTATAVLGPAWSLSLEWQFYLVAPAFVWLLANPRWRLATVAGVGLMAVLWHFDVFGDYMAPSFLPAAAYVFLIGIVCRLTFDRIRAIAIGPEFVPFVLLVGVIYREVFWLAIWAAMLANLACGESWRSRTGRAHGMARWMDRLFASPAAVYLGARSYSVYLVHMPVIMTLTWVVAHLPLGITEARLALVAGSIAATLVLSDILYRAVERPMIALGARLAQRRTPVGVPAE